MTVPSTLDVAGWLRNHLDGDDGDADLARAMVQAFAEVLMSAEASMQCQAGLRRTQRGARQLAQRLSGAALGHRVGTIDLKVPKLREGSYFPAWLLVHRRRAEQALASVVAQAYVEGVSTRRVEDLVEAMGIAGISHVAGDAVGWRRSTSRSPSSVNGPSMPAPTGICGSTPWRRRSVRAAGWSTCRR